MSKKPSGTPVPLSLAKKRRAQQHAKQTKEQHKVTLERVLGLTCLSDNSLSSCPTTGAIAYPAGCVAVLFLPKKNLQLHVPNRSRKPISSLCLSPDGKYLATGECGHQPCVRVWSLSDSLTQVAELKGHSFGISCVVFSPNLKYLVSVGYQHDMLVNVWSWKSGVLVASNKITSRMLGVSFAEDGSYFVTVGSRRVRFWYFDTTGRDGRLNQAHPLKGRSVILGELQNNTFTSVACGRGTHSQRTYVLAEKGFLCLFDAKRQLDRFIEIQAPLACTLAASQELVFCGCSNGIIRVFHPVTLDYLFTMPRPHALGVNIATALDPSQFSSEGGSFPDVTAVTYDEANKRLTVVYNDHSLYIWDLRNTQQIGKTHSFLYHSACIWDATVYPAGADQEKGVVPDSCFVTCSSDNTVRFWCLDAPHASLFMATASRDRLVHVFTANGDYKHIQTLGDHSASITAIKFAARESLQLLSCGADKSIMFRKLEESPEPSFTISNHIVGKAAIYDMDVDAVGKRFATASQDKLLRVYNIATGKQASIIKAHTSDDGSLLRVTFDPSGLFLASSSSDKSISLFDFYSGQCLAHLYGHSEVVTQVVFSKDCKYMYSVSGDSCIFVWRLSREFTQAMHDRLAEMKRPLPPSFQLTPHKDPRRETFVVSKDKAEGGPEQIDTGGAEEEEEEAELAGFRFSVSKLPLWAQKKLVSGPAGHDGGSAGEAAAKGAEAGKNPPPVEGRWAERMPEGQIHFASQGESDSDIEELASEMTRLITEEDLNVIDLTDDVVDLTEDSAGVGDGRVTVRGGAGDKEDIIYPTLKKEEDPSVFQVTTPKKRTRSEVAVSGADVEPDSGEIPTDDSDSSGSPCVSPESSPNDGRRDFAFDEEKFLKTNFESLSADKIEALFDGRQQPAPIDARLSISARFFSEGLRRDPIRMAHGPYGKSRDNGASPCLVAGVDPPRSSDRSVSGGSEEPGGGCGRGLVAVEEVSCGEIAGEESTNSSEKPGHTSGKARRKSIEEEIMKTKKRLEELGYLVSDKEPESAQLETGGLHKKAKVKTKRVQVRPSVEHTATNVGGSDIQKPQAPHDHDTEVSDDFLTSRATALLQTMGRAVEELAEVQRELFERSTSTVCESAVAQLSSTLVSMRERLDAMSGLDKEVAAGSGSSVSLGSEEGETRRHRHEIPLAQAVAHVNQAVQTDGAALLSSASADELQRGISAQVADLMTTLDISSQVADIVKKNLQLHT